MATEESLKMNEVLRHEAGEGLHGVGLNGEVLRAIIRREQAADRITKLSGLEKFGSDEMKDYLHKAEQVNLLKEEYGIPDPEPLVKDSPPLPPEDN